jgi:hypothetical protein
MKRKAFLFVIGVLFFYINIIVLRLSLAHLPDLISKNHYSGDKSDLINIGGLLLVLLFTVIPYVFNYRFLYKANKLNLQKIIILNAIDTFIILLSVFIIIFYYNIQDKQGVALSELFNPPLMIGLIIFKQIVLERIWKSKVG